MTFRASTGFELKIRYWKKVTKTFQSHYLLFCGHQFFLFCQRFICQTWYLKRDTMLSTYLNKNLPKRNACYQYDAIFVYISLHIVAFLDVSKFNSEDNQIPWNLLRPQIWGLQLLLFIFCPALHITWLKKRRYFKLPLQLSFYILWNTLFYEFRLR